VTYSINLRRVIKSLKVLREKCDLHGGGGIIVVISSKKISWPRTQSCGVIPSTCGLLWPNVGVLLLFSSSDALYLFADSMTSWHRDLEISCLRLAESKSKSLLA
jgi:hypothetical protein